MIHIIKMFLVSSFSSPVTENLSLVIFQIHLRVLLTLPCIQSLAGICGQTGQSNPRSFDLTPLTLFPTISVCKLMFQPTSLCFQKIHHVLLLPMCLCSSQWQLPELYPHPLTPLHNALFMGNFGVGQKFARFFPCWQKNPTSFLANPRLPWASQVAQW